MFALRFPKRRSWLAGGAPKAPLVAPVPPPIVCEGAIDELSEVHVAGWAFDPQCSDDRVSIEAVLDGSGEPLARARADQFTYWLAAAGKGDGAHGFYVRWPRPLSADELARVRVRTLGPTATTLARVGSVRTEYNPLLHVAMDIVDNCNLRCPFCLYDYSGTHATNLMDDATLAAALRFLPYTWDGEFWFSCLHEPTLHPKLMSFIDQVPREFRRKIFFTSNLAKRMPQRYFEWLATSGIHHINISIESRDPAIYERMRKGARHRIFQANLETLLGARPQGAGSPFLRYIVMAYKSNLHELPELVHHLFEERQARQVEIRYTYDVPHIPPGFKQAEYLEPQDWRWLQEQFSQYTSDRLMLVAPPNDAAPAVPAAKGGASDGVGDTGATRLAVPPQEAAGAVLAGRYMFRLSWDGSLRVQGILAASRNGEARERQLLSTNIRDIADPRAFFDELDASA